MEREIEKDAEDERMRDIHSGEGSKNQRYRQTDRHTGKERNGSENEKERERKREMQFAEWINVHCLARN